MTLWRELALSSGQDQPAVSASTLYRFLKCFAPDGVDSTDHKKQKRNARRIKRKGASAFGARAPKQRQKKSSYRNRGHFQQPTKPVYFSAISVILVTSRIAKEGRTE